MQPHLNDSISATNENLRTDLSNETMQERKNSWLHQFLSRFGGKTIFVYDKLYLTRYYILGDGSGTWFEIYVHHMHATDSFRWLHNHPWSGSFRLSSLVPTFKTLMIETPTNSTNNTFGGLIYSVG